MSKKRRLSIIALIVIGGLYVIAIIVGLLGNTALTLVLVATSSILSIIVYFVLLNIKRNNEESNMLIEEGHEANFPGEKPMDAEDIEKDQ